MFQIFHVSVLPARAACAGRAVPVPGGTTPQGEERLRHLEGVQQEGAVRGNMQDLAGREGDLHRPFPPQPGAPQALFQDGLCGCVEKEPQVRIVIQAHGIVPLHQIEVVPLVQDRKRKRALHRLSHAAQAVRCEGFLLLNELDRHIAVGLNLGGGEVSGRSERLVVAEDAVVGQREAVPGDMAGEGVVVPVIEGIALGGHPGVPQNDVGVPGNGEGELTGGNRALVDAELAAGVVGNAGGIGAPSLTGGGQRFQQPGLLTGRETVGVVDQSKETAHQASTSLSTGSLT